MNKAIIILTLVIIFGCKKSNTDTTNVNTGGSGSGTPSTTGVLSFNVTWTQPSLVVGCGMPVDVVIELTGPNNYFYTETQQVGPVEIRKRLDAGNYSYKVTKSRRSSCYTVTTVVKTGVFNLPTCPTACNNPTIINVVAN